MAKRGRPLATGHFKTNNDLRRAVFLHKECGHTLQVIAEAVGVSRPTVATILRERKPWGTNRWLAA